MLFETRDEAVSESSLAHDRAECEQSTQVFPAVSMDQRMGIIALSCHVIEAEPILP